MLWLVVIGIVLCVCVFMYVFKSKCEYVKTIVQDTFRILINVSIVRVKAEQANQTIYS